MKESAEGITDIDSDEYLAAVEQASLSNDTETLLHLAGDLHQADLGDLLERLDFETRLHIIELLGDNFDFATLTEMDEGNRLRLLERLPVRLVAFGIGALRSDDAVYILEDLPPQERAEILAHLSDIQRRQVTRALDYPEDSAGRLMQSEFVAVPPFWTVGQTIDFMRTARNLPEKFYEIFVVDVGFRLVGTVALDRILQTPREVRISHIQTDDIHHISVSADREEAAWLFDRYDLVSLAVVEGESRLVGVLTADYIVEVVKEETEEDMRALAGVGDEEISDNVPAIARSRFKWLFINLFTALLTSFVISQFDGTISAMVSLAVLMPIVASLGGNAATQTMTVAVRAIATRQLDRHNIWWVMRREVFVAMLNGVLLALLVGAVAATWYARLDLGLVIGLAIITNVVCAGSFGLIVPMTLNHFKIDPAIASSVFVTTVTDVVGFFGFLMLAAWWFGLPF